MPALTIIICTHDRLQLLVNAIASLNAAHRPDGLGIEILAVANACTDRTAQWLDEYSRGTENDHRLPLRWIEEPRIGKSFALNAALDGVESSLLAFVDDDHRVDHAYLAEICKSARLFPSTTMFCGRVQPDWDGSEPDWVHDQGPYRVYPPPVPSFELGPEPREVTPSTSIPGGGNLYFRKDVLSRVGGFRTDLGPKGRSLGGSEDTDFVLRALRLGESMRYVPSVIQYHYVDPRRLRLGYVLAKSYQRSKSVTLVRGACSAGLPLYLWRKLFMYLTKAILSLSWVRTRFYLVRLMATMGEMRGLSNAGNTGK